MAMTNWEAADVLRLVGRNVMRRRTAAELTQAELADAAGLSRSYVNEVEHGRRNLTVQSLHRIALALGCIEPDLFEVDAEVNASAVLSPLPSSRRSRRDGRRNPSSGAEAD